ncbi:MAG: hypothetical protein IJ960_03070 [Oscillospiraceae bacterium]|nr:hypothetical protein [Oscillospiraceae bacterium]
MEYEYGMTGEEKANPLEVKAPENLLFGIIGALVGALIGGGSIILLSQLGYIASISGVILAVCTLKGYELLAKGMSVKGLVVCAILMLVTPFAADWIDWGILVMQSFPEYGLTLADGIRIFPELLKEDPELVGEYLKNLGMIYLFVILGSFYTVKNAFRKQK